MNYWFVVRYFCWLMASSVLIQRFSTARIVLFNREMFLPSTAFEISFGLAILSTITAIMWVEEEYARRGLGRETIGQYMNLPNKSFILGGMTGACWIISGIVYFQDGMLTYMLFFVAGLVPLMIELGGDRPSDKHVVTDAA